MENDGNYSTENRGAKRGFQVNAISLAPTTILWELPRLCQRFYNKILVISQDLDRYRHVENTEMNQVKLRDTETYRRPRTVRRITDCVFIIILDMIPAVFGKLKDSGFFFDPVARDIETNFIPSLLEKVKTKVRFYTHHMVTFYILMPVSLKPLF